MKGFKRFSLNVPTEESPLHAIVDERLNPPKRVKMGIRKYTIDHLLGFWCSSFWKDFFPKWMKQNGFRPTATYSLEAWHLMASGAGKEYKDNSDRFKKTHDALLASGNVEQAVVILGHC